MGRNPRSNPVNQARVDTAERQRAALELKLSGANYTQIAQTLGFANRGGAYKAVHAALKEIIREPAEAVKQMELERLDRWLLALAPKLRPGNIDLPTLDRALRIMERRAKYEGLDAPTKQTIHWITEDVVDSEIARLEQLMTDRAGGRDAEDAGVD